MDLIYQLGIRFYTLVARLAAPFHEKARFWHRGRQLTFPYLREQIDGTSPVIWVHCASLGEFEQGRPLIEAIKKQQPGFKILLTFFSPSGYEVRKNYNQADYICYLPADTPRNARRFVELVQPRMVFFIKYEFWKNFISELNRKKIPLYLVSGIFRPGQLFFKKGIRARWYRGLLKGIEHFFVQNQQSADLLAGIGFENSTVTGDTRFDRVAEIAANRKDLPLVEQFKGNSKLIVAGSSWQPDEEILAEYLKVNKSVKLVVAPHEVKETNIKRLLGLFPEKAVRYSEAKGDLSEYRILVIDSIGILSSIYRYAGLAYIGGGFGVGIHNTLEAAIYNIPVIFGPNYLRFQEAVELVRRELAFPVANAGELTSRLDRLISDENRLAEIARGCEQFMTENIGATQLVLSNVFAG
ncbi:3-deoxy-D-manno-octulosonic acid transferase [Gaoshiqia sp. Z1-71]|uniref:3-deoxy-D-manno-octulosonic acid transferase n=1 Tax=Gaoshiqia hydrogeniformans TaxID=3290090 RepID=UPI003BF9170D